MEVDNRNDRLNLVLLSCLEVKSKKDDERIAFLQSRYPDHKTFELGLLKGLIERDMVSRTDLTPERPGLDENGNPVAHEFSPYSTNRSGRIALDNNLFPSNITEQARKERHARLDNWVKWVAVIGGLLGLFNFFHTLLKG